MLNEFFVRQDADTRFLIILILAITVLFGTSYILGARVERGDVSVPSETVFNEFPFVSLEAKAAYVYDARTKTVLFAKNENTRLPLASITKLMAALVARELSPEYGTVTITKEAIALDGDSGLKPGEKWSLKDLLDFSLISSSNDGMRAVALAFGALNQSEASSEEIVDDFVRKMNAKAAELGLNNTYFWNETGLDESEYKGGAYGTVRDISTLMEYILLYQPELLEATREEKITINSHTAENTNDIISYIPGFLGSKTGYTNTAGGNLTFAFDAELGRPIIITLFGSTEQGRFEDAKTLINATLSYINGSSN